MQTEQQDREIYNQVKRYATGIVVEDGSAVVIPIEPYLQNERIEIIAHTATEVVRAIRPYLDSKKPYAVINRLHDKFTFAFYGFYFLQKDNLNTGEILTFSMHNKEKFNVEDLKQEWRKLEFLLKNSKTF